MQVVLTQPSRKQVSYPNTANKFTEQKGMHFKLWEEGVFPQISAFTKPYFSQRGFTQ
jgi:hypothetical protein